MDWLSTLQSTADETLLVETLIFSEYGLKMCCVCALALYFSGYIHIFIIPGNSIPVCAIQKVKSSTLESKSDVTAFCSRRCIKNSLGRLTSSNDQ